jgi:hypothetical protein
MYIPDLYTFPAGHPPSPYGRVGVGGPERFGFLWLADHLTLRAVGWVGNHLESQGRVSDECVERILSAPGISDGTEGGHQCEICLAAGKQSEGNRDSLRWRDKTICVYGHGHNVFIRGTVAYMCPVLIVHYIVTHSYKPPDEFLAATLEGRPLQLADLLFEEVGDAYRDRCRTLRDSTNLDDDAHLEPADIALEGTRAGARTVFQPKHLFRATR